MPKPISNDLRKRIIDYVSEGYSAREAAGRFKVSPSFAIKLVKRYRETGSYFSHKIGGYRSSVLSPYKDEIINLIEAHPDRTLLMHVQNIKKTYNIEIHQSTLHRFLSRLGYSYKKNCIRKRAGQS